MIVDASADASTKKRVALPARNTCFLWPCHYRSAWVPLIPQEDGVGHFGGHTCVWQNWKSTHVKHWLRFRRTGCGDCNHGIWSIQTHTHTHPHTLHTALTLQYTSYSLTATLLHNIHMHADAVQVWKIWGISRTSATTIIDVDLLWHQGLSIK